MTQVELRRFSNLNIKYAHRAHDNQRRCNSRGLYVPGTPYLYKDDRAYASREALGTSKEISTVQVPTSNTYFS
jgi:hypothetical protein